MLERLTACTSAVFLCQVHNAIDAGAKEIEVSVDLPCHKFQVSDDGAGISQSDLCKIAKRY